MPVRAAPLVAAVLALGVAGCGGGDDKAASRSGSSGATGQSAGAAPKRADAAAAAVIRGWVDAARSGNMRKAAGYFTLPTIVANGSAPVALTTRAEVVAFNNALPCGARLVRAVASSGYTIATFRLTNRPGGNCQGGEGEIAYTAFRVRDGKIRAWIRVSSEAPPSASPVPRPTPSGPSPPVVSA